MDIGHDSATDVTCVTKSATKHDRQVPGTTAIDIYPPLLSCLLFDSQCWPRQVWSRERNVCSQIQQHVYSTNIYSVCSLFVVFFMLWNSCTKPVKRTLQCYTEVTGTWEAVGVDGLQQQKEVGPMLGILFKVLQTTPQTTLDHTHCISTYMVSTVLYHNEVGVVDCNWQSVLPDTVAILCIYNIQGGRKKLAPFFVRLNFTKY